MTYVLTRKRAYQIIRELNETVFEGEIPVDLLDVDVLDGFEPIAYVDCRADKEVYGVDLPERYVAYVAYNETDEEIAYNTIANLMGRVILLYNEVIEITTIGDIVGDYQDHPLFQYYSERGGATTPRIFMEV